MKKTNEIVALKADKLARDAVLSNSNGRVQDLKRKLAEKEAIIKQQHDQVAEIAIISSSAKYPHSVGDEVSRLSRSNKDHDSVIERERRSEELVQDAEVDIGSEHQDIDEAATDNIDEDSSEATSEQMLEDEEPPPKRRKTPSGRPSFDK